MLVEKLRLFLATQARLPCSCWQLAGMASTELADWELCAKAVLSKDSRWLPVDQGNFSKFHHRPKTASKTHRVTRDRAWPSPGAHQTCPCGWRAKSAPRNFQKEASQLVLPASLIFPVEGQGTRPQRRRQASCWKAQAWDC